MRTRVVLDLVLDELKSRKPDTVKRKMIGPTGVRHRKRLRFHVGEWSKPRFEVRPDPGIALHIDTADPACAVVEIVVGGKLVVICGLHQLTGCVILTTLAFTKLLFHIFA